MAAQIDPKVMTPERWQQITNGFHASPRAMLRRATHFDQASAGDRELRAEVEAMLKAHEGAGADAFTSPAPAGDDTPPRKSRRFCRFASPRAGADDVLNEATTIVQALTKELPGP